MLISLLVPPPTPLPPLLAICRSFRKNCTSYYTSRDMGLDNLTPRVKRAVDFRLCNVSSYTTELLEIQADDPTMRVLVIPGNPGVVTFYKDFVESLYELLGGSASITAVGHVAQTRKNWERGRLFSLQEQIDHKMDFIRQELQNNELPVILVFSGEAHPRNNIGNETIKEQVGHSIGSYISIEMLRRSSEKVIYCIGLYPFLALNQQSVKQSIIGKIAASSTISAALSHVVACLGFLPSRALRFVVSKCLGGSWSAAAVEAACTHLSQYHVMRNVLFMAMTEFIKLSEAPNWAFMRGNQDKIAFLFGIDDHWGPLHMVEEISKQAPDIALSIEREGHTHSFCCTQAGSLWVAGYVANLIKRNF